MSQFKSCIEACQQCVVACTECLEAMGGKKSDNDCPSCCAQCIDICEACVKAMARDSKYASQICQLCAEMWAARSRSLQALRGSLPKVCQRMREHGRKCCVKRFVQK